jgi:hypothetical protein
MRVPATLLLSLASACNAILDIGEPTLASAPADAPLANLGSGGAADLAIAPAAPDFGSVPVGMTADLQIDITNRGDGSSGVLTVDADGDEFPIVGDTCTGGQLDHGGQCRVKVRFRPAATGARSAQLSVTSAGGSGAGATLRGTGVKASVVTISPVEKDFGSALHGTLGAGADFIVRNPGEAETAIAVQLTAGTDFAITANGCTGSLPGLGQCTLTVQFRPMSAAPLQDELIVTDGAGGVATAKLSGTGLGGAALELSRTSYDFGSWPENASPTFAFTVKNVGDAGSGPLSATSSDPSVFAVDAGDCATLARGASCTLSVRFAAVAPPGARSAILTVAAGPGVQATTSLTGTTLGHSDVTVTPSVVVYDATALGARSQPVSFHVANNGTAAADLGAPALSGNDPASFTLGASDCPPTLGGGDSCSVTVAFQPTAVGARSSSLALGGAAAALSGTGTAQLTVLSAGTGSGTVASSPAGIDCGPTCAVAATAASVTLTATADARSDFTSWSGAGCSGTGSCTVTMDGARSVTATFTRKPAALAIRPVSQYFGAETLGAATPSIDFTVENTGGEATGPLAAEASDASYAITGGSCVGAALDAGSDCTVSVRFAPSGSSGPKPATLTVHATPGASAEAALTASALSPGALTLDPGAWDFGSIGVGTASAEKLFTVANGGDSATGTLAIALSDPAFAATSSDCPPTLAARQQCHVGVTLTPGAAGATQGVSLTVTASPGGVAASTLQGLGTAQVAVTNLGGGTVASTDGRIQCGATCSATYTAAPVTLRAAPDASHDFAGWSGACTAASGDCTLPLGATTNAVTATFALKQAALALSDTSKDFGAITLGGQSAPIDFTVRNAGAQASGTISASVTDTADYAITGSTCSGTLAGGASCKVSVRFNPTGQSGAKPATLSVTAAPGGTVSASLSGSALTPGALALSQGSKDFGTVAAFSASAESSFTVTNTGQSATSTPSVTVSDPSSFTVSTNGCTGPLAASGGTCTIGVKFTPQGFGAKSASLVVSVTGSTSTASLTGTGTVQLTVTKTGAGTVSSGDATISCGPTCSASYSAAPTLSATPDPGFTFTGWSGDGCTGTGTCTPLLTGTAMTTVVASFTAIPAALSLTPSSGSFGSIPVGQTSGRVDFTVKNTGGTTSGMLGAPTLSDPANFTVSSNTCPSSLGAGATCTIGVTFTPTSVGAKSGGSLTVTASGNGTASAALQGTGTAQVTVTNAGGGTVTSSPAGISCGATCTASFSAPVTLTATPDGTHVFAGWSGACTGMACTLPLSAATNDVTASFTVPSAASFAIASQESSDFGQVDVGSTSDPITFTVTNTGQQASNRLTVSITSGFATMNDTCTDAMLGPNDTCTVDAQFEPGAVGASSGTLTISATGAISGAASLAGTGKATVTVTRHGSGTVSSSPAGITCPSTCSAGFSTTPVTLTASPAAGYYLKGWMGACAGAGSTCWLTTILSSLTTCEADFAPCETTCPMGYTCGTWFNSCGTRLTCGPLRCDLGTCINNTCQVDP